MQKRRVAGKPRSERSSIEPDKTLAWLQASAVPARSSVKQDLKVEIESCMELRLNYIARLHTLDFSGKFGNSKDKFQYLRYG